MGVSISSFVNVNVVLAGAAADRFSFGKTCGVFTHSVAGATRFMGPYASVADGEAAGFTAAAVPKVHAWLSAVFGQEVAVDEVYIGRIVGGDANLTATLDAVAAVAGEDGFYLLNIESRAEADILLAAAWAESHGKVFIAQTSDTLGAQVSTVTFAGVTNTAGDYKIRVQRGDVDKTFTYTSAGSQTSAQIATAMISAWNLDAEVKDIAVAATGGSGVVQLTFAEPGTNWTVTAPAPAGGTATPATSPAATGDTGSQLELAGYNRTALLWHYADDHTEGVAPPDGYADGAWTSRCGGMNLDSPGGVGNWTYKTLAGITADSISNSDAADFFEVNTNLFHQVKGLRFTSKGTMASGRHIDVTISLDWLKVRVEEAILSLFVGEPRKVPFTSAGINRIEAAIQSVLERGVTYGHLSGDHPRLVSAPKLSEVSSQDKVNRTLTFTVSCTLAGAIESVTIEITVEQ
jgi:hypothetical protein